MSSISDDDPRRLIGDITANLATVDLDQAAAAAAAHAQRQLDPNLFRRAVAEGLEPAAALAWRHLRSNLPAILRQSTRRPTTAARRPRAGRPPMFTDPADLRQALYTALWVVRNSVKAPTRPNIAEALRAPRKTDGEPFNARSLRIWLKQWPEINLDAMIEEVWSAPLPS